MTTDNTKQFKTTNLTKKNTEMWNVKPDVLES